MLKIGIVCYPTFGGSGIVASELGKHLSRKHMIHFISYEKPVRLNIDNSNIFYHKVEVPKYPLFEYPPYELALTAKIVEIVEKYNLDILHVHYAIPHAYAAVSAQQILKQKSILIPIVTTLHGTDITLVGTLPHLLSSVNYALNQSSLITCVSKDLKLQTLQHFKINNRIDVIPNFIDFNQNNFSALSKNNKKIISHISNFRPVKRIEDVILIFNNISKKIASELLLIGEGPERLKAEQLVIDLGLKEKVKFLGKSNNIEKVLRKSDLFLLPSESESFGLVALEAMSFSTPVITSRSGGVVELVIDGLNGFTCDVGDVESMSEKAIDLLSNKNAYLKMREAAFKRAKKYDSKYIVPIYEAAYMKLIK
tara:strand:- start:3824 stop:4924 length:1101 start_codon:yes stop_codon:yes gene_type:complete